MTPPHLIDTPTADARTRRRRRLRLACTLVGGSVRRALLPPCSARGRERVKVCRAANVLAALDVRVQVVGGAVPWPRSDRVVVSDHTGWLGELALSTALPRTPVMSRARALPAGSVVCPVVVRYRPATGYLGRDDVPRTPTEVAAVRDLVIEVHRLPALGTSHRVAA